MKEVPPVHEDNRLYRLVMPRIPPKLRPLADRYWELLTYLIFGVLTTLVNYIFYFLLKPLLGYLAANVLAWVFAVAFAFVTNKLFVFETKTGTRERLIREAARFAAARLFSLGLEELLLFLLVERMGASENLTKIFTSVVVVIVNYVLSKLLVFRKKK